MLHRKIETDIKNWLENSNKALLIDGARQVGKTFIINKVLNDFNVPYFSFNLIQNKEIIDVFNNSKDINSFIRYLELVVNKEIKKGSIIFFDEIQECKEITTQIKFLVEQNDYRFILSGSLLGIELTNLKSAPVGYLEILHMYPLDLEEFATNQGVSDDVIKELKYNFDTKTKVNEFVHKKMMEVFRNYLLVGGMPDAVNNFVNESSFNEIDKIHKNIIELYKKDFTKYEENKKLKLIKIYDLIPSEINDENKRFIFTDLENNARFSKYENSFNWLIDAGVSLATYNVKEPRLPLRLNMDHSSFKFFMSDVGLLTSCYGEASKLSIIKGENSINAGSIYENFVASELKAHGYDLYYFNNRRLGELDFVIEYKDCVLPIEVKSGKDYKRHSALNNALKSEVYKIKEAYVFNNSNIKVVSNITYYPIYMVMFIKKDEAKLIHLEKVIL